VRRRPPPRRPRRATHIAPGAARSATALPIDELVARFYAGAATTGGSVALVDHDTDGICPGLPRRYLSWELAPGAHHLIEAVAQRA